MSAKSVASRRARAHLIDNGAEIDEAGVYRLVVCAGLDVAGVLAHNNDGGVGRGEVDVARAVCSVSSAISLWTYRELVQGLRG